MPWSHRNGTLGAERATRLEGLPAWSWKPIADLWEEAFARLSGFVKQVGHAAVREDEVIDGFKLGQWISVQRSAYKAGRLIPERVAQLEALAGWRWQPRADAWDEGFDRLSRFVDRTGTARVPRACVEDNYALGKWVGTQRAAYREGRLDPERARRLEALPGWAWITRSPRTSAI
jgi:Helicase associated domain